MPATAEAVREAARSPNDDENPFKACGRGWRDVDPESIAEHATPRPMEVVLASDDSPHESNFAKVVIPRWKLRPKSARAVAAAAVDICNERLHQGLSLNLVFRHPAFGRDQIAKRTGLDRNTCASWLRELFGNPVGQLKDWTDSTNGELKTGAFQYRPTVVFHHFGDLVERALKAVESAPEHLRYALKRLTLNATSLGGSGRERRLEGCLQGVLEKAKLGNRNALGYWLVRRCIDVGLTEGEAQHWIERFWEQVRWMGGHEYKWREATATLRSAYRLRVSTPGGRNAQ